LGISMGKSHHSFPKDPNPHADPFRRYSLLKPEQILFINLK
jgi:hypothetical protein